MYLGRDYQWQHVATDKAIWDTGINGVTLCFFNAIFGIFNFSLYLCIEKYSK